MILKIRKLLIRLNLWILHDMHIAHPGLNSNNTKKQRKKLTAKQQKAIDDHNLWLKTQGLHTDQLHTKFNKSKKLVIDYKVDDTHPCSNKFEPAGAKHSIFDSQWKKTYDDDINMQEREKIALRKAENLKADLMPLYNKGPVMLKPKQLSMTDLGKRRP